LGNIIHRLGLLCRRWWNRTGLCLSGTAVWRGRDHRISESSGPHWAGGATAPATGSSSYLKRSLAYRNSIEGDSQMKPVLTSGNYLRQLFAALTEHTFHAELGVADPQLTEYLTDLQLRFVNMDAIFRIRDTGGR